MFIELRTKAKKKRAVLETYLVAMIEREASDFFLIPGEPPSYRVHGVIERSDADPLTERDVRRLATWLFRSKNLRRLGREIGVLHGTATLAAAGAPGSSPQRILIAASRSQGGLTLAGRTIPWGMPTPEKIRLPQAVLDAAAANNGLIIFSGPTGSGKTTAAASVLDHINETRPGHICLVGEPVEFTIEPKRSILQYKNVGVDVPDLTAGMRAAMAQDLDVLYLQEIRDVDELKVCLATCLTGHLVVTVLHAATAADAVARVLSALPADQRDTLMANFAEALRCVVALKLLPKAEGQGRVAAYDVLVPDAQLRAEIAGGGDLRGWSEPLPEGCTTFAESISQLQDEGLITPEVAEEGLAEFQPEK